MTVYECCGDCPCCDAYSACWTARGVVHKQEIARLETDLSEANYALARVHALCDGDDTLWPRTTLEIAAMFRDALRGPQ